MRGAFTAQRLEAVRLLAGQVAVSLDNAQGTSMPAKFPLGHCVRLLKGPNQASHTRYPLAHWVIH
jgi:hypothetical protein